MACLLPETGYKSIIGLLESDELESDVGSLGIKGFLQLAEHGVKQRHDVWVDKLPCPELMAAVPKAQFRDDSISGLIYHRNDVPVDAEKTYSFLKALPVNWSEEHWKWQVSAPLSAHVRNYWGQHSKPMYQICDSDTASFWVFTKDAVIPDCSTALPAGYSLGCLEPSDAEFVAQNWKFSRKDTAASFAYNFANLPTSCIRNSMNQLASYCQVDVYGALCIGHVIPEERGRGLARIVMNDIIAKIRSMGMVPYGHIDNDNAASIRLTTSLGWKKTGFEDTWIVAVEKPSYFRSGLVSRSRL